MTDVRDYDAERGDIRQAVVRRVGGDAGAIVDGIASGFSSPLHASTIALLPHVIGAAFGGSFDARVDVEGPLAELRELARDTTLVLAPTHASNLDSIILGLVAARAGLPPFAYAAGKHIFRNRLFAALMRRLGAFQLDPDRRDRLYMRVVNVYVNELFARGYHTVVFPSGTRGRSGEVESTVKLGLLGAAVHVARPVRIVPVTMTYQIVPEAEHLIAYYLAGRSHERIVGDELFLWGRLRDTARRFRRLDQRVAVRFDQPIDPHAPGRWRTRIATELTAAYRRGTVFFATHIVARALYDLDRAIVPRNAVTAAISATHARLGGSKELAGFSGEEILDAALAAWDSWHRTPPVIRRGTNVHVVDRALVLFYRNRTVHA
jgi:glycerol-3-phosphate O-acyltransferase